MMSVALQDAFTFRSRGQLVCARQQVGVSSELLGRTAHMLGSACQSLMRSGEHIAAVPHVEPLRTEFFRGDTGQSAASWNGILHHVLFAERSRFFHKLRILATTVEHIDEEFHQAASDVADGVATEPQNTWMRLDSLHYDFNTCLRETEVVLKSVLQAIPSEFLGGLSAELEKQLAPAPRPVRLRARPYRIPA
jgi:hypothetical protein